MKTPFILTFLLSFIGYLAFSQTLTLSGSIGNPAISERPSFGFVAVLKNTSKDTLYRQNIRDGQFEFTQLQKGDNYTLKIEILDRNDDLNGVSTLDRVLIIRNILGIQGFTSPLQSIAADVDGDGSISVFDIVLINNLILGRTNRFNESYRVRTVEDISNDTYIINDLNEDKADLNFYTIKIGDVNGSHRY